MRTELIPAADVRIGDCVLDEQGAPAVVTSTRATCGRQTSVTAETIFHRIRTPLSTWFAAIWFLMSQKNGMSALGLQRVLWFGSYETAWAWLQKLRRAMVRPDRDLLSGVVELDEVFVGNESRGAASGMKDNTAVMVAVESLNDRRLGRVRLELAEVARSSNLVGFAMRVIEEGSVIKIDGATNLKRLAGLGYEHQRFVGVDSKEPAHVNLPGVPHGRVAAQTLAHRNPALRRVPGAPGLLPGRVHVPVQPPHVQQPRTAVLSAPPAGREHRPAPTR